MRVLIGMIGLVICCVAPMLDAASIADEKKSLHVDWLDRHVRAPDDFYAYANGNWQKHNPIPPQYSSWGTFSIIHENVQKQIHRMLINAADNKSVKTGDIAQKIGDFYFSGMDEVSINKLGVTPLKPDLNRINAIKNLKDLQAMISYLHQIGVNVVFNFGSMQDFADSKEMIGAAQQGGLGLPDRDYYLKEDVKFKQIRAAYIKYMCKMFGLLGETPVQAANDAQVVMRIETTLAEASMSQIAQRDPHAVYHMMNFTELDKVTPNFSWDNYFAGIGLSSVKRINLAMPIFFKKMNELLRTVTLTDWKIYLRWHLIDSFSPYLSNVFVDEQFHMSAALTGAKKLLPRWQRVVEAENEALGFAIGKLYVEKYFPPSSKQDVVHILKNIRQVLHHDLETLSWMTPATRKAALAKLDLIQDRVGYPSKWWDYSTLVIDRGPYVLNVKRANQFLFKRDCNKIGKPVDKSEWAMTPQTINAYYDPSMNNINIPAGILQSPFFDPKAPAAVNYGAIGFVIGHEITHGFDDQGAQFDGNGNLKNWWTPADLKKFNDSTHCIMTQFSQYKVDGNLAVQGKLVMGEATADLGGLILAYRAFHESDAYKKAKIIDGFTPDQQFFLGVAHVWALNIRPEKIRNLITTDPHPPAVYRINGTLANMPQFQSAFAVPDSSPMVKADRCVIW